MYEVLDTEVSKQPIAHKEGLAFAKTVLPNLEVLRNTVVSWHVDNMNVRQAWLNSSTIKDKWLCKEVVQMQILLHNQGTKIIPVYIRSAQHLHADYVSRNKPLPDWHLSRLVARKLFQSMGLPQVDLMATSKSLGSTQRYERTEQWQWTHSRRIGTGSVSPTSSHTPLW